MEELIDTHHHLWTLSNGADYPWLKPGAPLSHNGNVEAIRRDYSIDDYRSDVQSVRLLGSVHIEAGRSAVEALKETRWVQRIIDTHGLPSALVANVDLWSPDFRSHLAEHLHFPALRAVRVRLNKPGQPLHSLGPEALRVADPAWDRAGGVLADNDLRIELQVTPAMAIAASALAEKLSSVRMVLTHAGFPFDRTPEGMAQWAAGLKRLGEHPNLYLKISGIGMTDHSWTDDSMTAVIQTILSVFPVQRLMIGTNLPVDGLYSSPERLLRTMLSALSPLDAVARRKVLIQTAQEFYRL